MKDKSPRDALQYCQDWAFKLCTFGVRTKVSPGDLALPAGCDSHTTGLGTTWELVRNAATQPHPKRLKCNLHFRGPQAISVHIRVGHDWAQRRGLGLGTADSVSAHLSQDPACDRGSSGAWPTVFCKQHAEESPFRGKEN